MVPNIPKGRLLRGTWMDPGQAASYPGFKIGQSKCHREYHKLEHGHETN